MNQLYQRVHGMCQKTEYMPPGVINRIVDIYDRGVTEHNQMLCCVKPGHKQDRAF